MSDRVRRRFKVSPAPPDPAEAERRLRAKRRAPIVLLAIGVALAALGGQGSAGSMALGAGAAFALAAALLGRVETRGWLVVACALIGPGILLRSLVARIDPRAEAAWIGLVGGGAAATLLARVLDPDWAKLAAQLGQRKGPQP